MSKKFKLRLTPEEYAALDDAGKSNYEQVGELYELSVDGVPDVAKAESTIRKLREREKELDGKLKTFDGFDVEEYKRLKAEREQIEQEKALKGKSDDERLQIMLQPMQTKFEADKRAWEAEKARMAKELDDSRNTHKTFRIRSELRSAAQAAKVLADYHDDVEMRASLFDIIDDQVVPVDSDGEPRRSPKDALKNMSVVEWIETDIAKSKPGWFPPSTGAGSGNGNRSATPRGVVNRDDQAGVLANVEKIAKGEMAVQ